MTAKTLTKTCSSHCRTCGRHFHGDQAFDLHRAFVDPKVPDWSQRVCLDPEGDADRLLDKHGRPKLVRWTDSGVCKIERGMYEPVEDVTIWHLNPPEGDADRLKGLR